MKTQTGHCIREYRTRHGISQEALAKKLGVRQSVISDYERGVLTPSIAQAHKLAAILGVSLDTLLSPQGENYAQLHTNHR